jgi:curved DNA-binding protein CbpA
MASADDYYEILQVSPNADEDVIQAAYKRLAFKWHPDKQPGNQSAADKMKQLNVAYEVLSNPQKRRLYDQRRQSKVAQAPPEATREETMPPAPPRRKKPRKGANDRLRKKKIIDLRGDSVVQSLAVCLVGMSFADLLMTYLLLRSGSQFYEANPIALWFFQRWNILGMTLFKFVLVGLVIALAEVIERNRQRWGRLLLIAACGVTGYAVVRGLRLYAGFDD